MKEFGLRFEWGQDVFFTVIDIGWRHVHKIDDPTMKGLDIHVVILGLGFYVIL